MDARGRSTNGSINSTTMPRLKGFTTSKPRTGFIVANALLINLFLLDLLARHPAYHFGVCPLPAAEEVADGEGQLDVCELLVGVVELFVRDGAEVIFDERLLRLR